jgi:hypothetical protein
MAGRPWRKDSTEPVTRVVVKLRGLPPGYVHWLLGGSVGSEHSPPKSYDFHNLPPLLWEVIFRAGTIKHWDPPLGKTSQWVCVLASSRIKRTKPRPSKSHDFYYFLTSQEVELLYSVWKQWDPPIGMTFHKVLPGETECPKPRPYKPHYFQSFLLSPNIEVKWCLVLKSLRPAGRVPHSLTSSHARTKLGTTFLYPHTVWKT